MRAEILVRHEATPGQRAETPAQTPKPQHPQRITGRPHPPPLRRHILSPVQPDSEATTLKALAARGTAAVTAEGEAPRRGNRARPASLPSSPVPHPCCTHAAHRRCLRCRPRRWWPTRGSPRRDGHAGIGGPAPWKKKRASNSGQRRLPPFYPPTPTMHRGGGRGSCWGVCRGRQAEHGQHGGSTWNGAAAAVIIIRPTIIIITWHSHPATIPIKQRYLPDPRSLGRTRSVDKNAKSGLIIWLCNKP